MQDHVRLSLKIQETTLLHVVCFPHPYFLVAHYSCCCGHKNHEVPHYLDLLAKRDEAATGGHDYVTESDCRNDFVVAWIVKLLLVVCLYCLV